MVLETPARMRMICSIVESAECVARPLEMVSLEGVGLPYLHPQQTPRNSDAGGSGGGALTVWCPPGTGSEPPVPLQALVRP